MRLCAPSPPHHPYYSLSRPACMEPTGRCYYTPLPRLVKRAGLTPAELTALNMDKSPLLEELLRDKYGGSEDALLGERARASAWVGC